MLKRMINGLGAILVGQVMITAGNVLIVPLYLAHWSVAVYGEWLALASLATYLSTLDLGMNMAVTNRLTQAYARHDLDEYARYQHSATLFYLAIALGGSVLLALIVWTLPVAAWLGLRETPKAEAAWVLWLLGAGILWSMPAGLIGGIYRTMGNLAASQWIGNLRNIITLILIATVVVLGGGLGLVALVQLLPLLLIIVIVLWHVRSHFPALMPGLTRVSRLTLIDLARPSLLFFIIMLASALSQQGPVLVVSSALGGAAVAVLVTSRTLTNLIRQVVGSFNNALWPDLTRLETLQEYGRLRALHRLLVKGTTTACIILAMALWYEGGEVITRWTAGRLQPDLTLLRTLLVQLVLQSPWLASSVLLAAANRHRKLAWSYLISGLIAVGVTAALVNRVGIVAVPIGLILGDAIACYHFVIRDTCQMISEPYGPFASRLWLGLAGVAGWAMGVGWLAHQTVPGPFLVRWAGVGMFVSVAVILMAWIVWFTAEDRLLLISLLRRLVASIRSRLGEKASP